MMFPKPKDQKRKDPDVVDGIRRFIDKTTGLWREICLTSAAKERRRREIYERDGGRCCTCRRPLRLEAPDAAPDRMHWHHEKHKGMGGAWTDDSIDNGKSLCRDCHLVTEHGHI